MRVLALHEDVILVSSRAYATNCVLVRGSGEEAFVIDSPVFPDELDVLPTIAAQGGFQIVGRLATHADWDHLLAGMAFPGAPLGVAPATAARLRDGPGAAQRALRGFDEELYVTRERPLQLGECQELPVPGACEVGPRELELIETGGHTADGMAVLVPWAGVLVCGDHLSPVEIPMLSAGGSIDAYLATLERLEPAVARADVVVPGHGERLDRERALAILREDRAYLEALRSDGAGAPLPLARRTGAQRKIHAENAARVVAGGAP